MPCQTHTVSGPIKKTSMSDDSSSDMMDLEESALVTDPHLETNLRRLREEERLLLEQQKAMEAAGNTDDIATLELLDALRLNQIKQHELMKQQAALAKRNARALGMDSARRDPRRRAPCNVRVNHLHSASAPDSIETDLVNFGVPTKGIGSTPLKGHKASLAGELRSAVNGYCVRRSIRAAAAAGHLSSAPHVLSPSDPHPAISPAALRCPRVRRVGILLAEYGAGVSQLVRHPPVTCDPPTSQLDLASDQ
ncbi:unnamed protein product [Leptosia nina]|uniref:Uncharacterized protein n=1 Tax=Leptosia nina TaxID=320188 RepID=A0AAV1JYP4_9NEOP